MNHHGNEEINYRPSSSISSDSKDSSNNIELNEINNSQLSNDSKKATNLNQDDPFPRDEFSIFGEHIACRMRNITNPKIRLLVQNQIHQLLFSAEMKNN